MGSGEDRFYVMSLINFTKGSYSQFYWYKDSYENMSDYQSTTKRGFGEGKNNTEVMITKWNNRAYGSQDNEDIWKHIQSEYEDGWFLPSIDEWSAIDGELGINRNNYTNYELDWIYLSSTQFDSNNAYDKYFASNGFIYDEDVIHKAWVRLVTTF